MFLLSVYTCNLFILFILLICIYIYVSLFQFHHSLDKGRSTAEQSSFTVDFYRYYYKSQEKIKTMLMQHFGRTKKVYYGIFDIG